MPKHESAHLKYKGRSSLERADSHCLNAPWLVECSARTVVPLAIRVWMRDMLLD